MLIERITGHHRLSSMRDEVRSTLICFLVFPVYPQKQQYAYPGYPAPAAYPGPYYHGSQYGPYNYWRDSAGRRRRKESIPGALVLANIVEHSLSRRHLEPGQKSPQNSTDRSIRTVAMCEGPIALFGPSREARLPT